MTDITWGMLRERPISELTVGQRLYKLDAFTAYSSRKDGRVFPLMGCECPGTIWIITSKEGSTFCVCREDSDITQEFTAHPQLEVLAILSPVSLKQIKQAQEVCDQIGFWRTVIRVNPKTVTTHIGEYVLKLQHSEIYEVR